MNKHTLSEAIKLLENYADDLRYALDESTDCLNYRTSGTPYFDSDAEAEVYHKGVYFIINQLKQEQDA